LGYCSHSTYCGAVTVSTLEKMFIGSTRALSTPLADPH
jgi:hypothetical protein